MEGNGGRKKGTSGVGGEPYPQALPRRRPWPRISALITPLLCRCHIFHCHLCIAEVVSRVRGAFHHHPPCGSAAMALSVSSLASCPATSTSTFFSGATSIQVNRGESKVTCKKADIHPEFFTDSKVYCNGELVMTTGGTQKEYVVDVWSGNHPFYQGNKSALLLDADRVEKFRQRYGGFTGIQEIPSGLTGEIVFEKKKKGGLKGKGKK